MQKGGTPVTCTANNLGIQLDCVDKRNYDNPYVTKGEIVYSDKWNILKENIDTEYTRRCKEFIKGSQTSAYYKHKYFEELKRKVGDIVTASGFNSLAQMVNDLGLECACNCAYCTCNCAYCSCSCDYCTCNCDYRCTCNCNYW